MIYGIDYFGFVYLWYDRSRRRYCLGSHMGKLDDGYVTGVKSFFKMYKIRPHDMKRRILQFATSPDRKSLYEMEGRWLSMIDDDELDDRYYNKRKMPCGRSPESVKQQWENPELKKRLSETSKQRWADPKMRKKILTARKNGKKRKQPISGDYVSKITKEDVIMIRSSDLSTTELSRHFGMTYQGIWRIRKRLSWKHI